MAELNLPIDCGAFVIEFYQTDKTQTDYFPIETNIFTRTATQFTIEAQSVESTIGVYDIYYEIAL